VARFSPALAAAWGVARPALLLRQGRRIETFVSGPGLANDHRLFTGAALTADAIVSGAANSGAACRSTLARYEERLARALAHVINVLDPDVIVVGGGLSNLDRLYQNVPGLWSQYVFSNRVDTRLAMNAHGDSSAVRGAAWLWDRPENRAGAP